MTRRQNVARSARACRLYRRLLIAYPARFRHTYGVEMEQVFAATYSETDRRAGFRSVAGFWMRALVDLLVSAGKERGATMAQWSPETRKQRGLITLVVLCSAGIGYWYTHAYEMQNEFICLLALAGVLGFVMPKRAWL